MASLKDMRVRIASTKATQKITKAMQMVAASKLRRAQVAAEAARPYAERMEKVLGNIAASVGNGPGAPRLLAGTGDDRVHLESAGGRLLVRPAETLAGLIEVRGAGIVRLDHGPCAVVGLVVELDATDAERLPEKRQIEIEGIELPRLAVAAGAAALPGVLALLTSSSVGIGRGCA